MKIGLFSDIHLEHRQEDGVHSHSEVINRIIETGEGVDLLINAGDTHPSLAVRENLRIKLSEHFPNYFAVNGNHDYYGDSFCYEDHTMICGDIKIFGAPMWTNFSEDPICESESRKYLNDFRMIYGSSVEKMKEAFYRTWEHAISEKPDIMVTHFAPSRRSIHPRWSGDILNSYFCPDAEKMLKEVSPKYLFHGHVHDPHDYEIENTRVIANPLGYPRETYRSIKDYRVKVIEI